MPLDFENPISLDDQERAQKKLVWEQTSRKINAETDALGEPIDGGIKEMIIGLNALGFNTVQSCEGHVDSGRPFPWVRVEAPNEPKERFVDQKKIISEIAEKYGCSSEDVERSQNEEAYVEAIRKYSENSETEEYKKWKMESIELEKKIQILFEEFYKNRTVEDSIKLAVDEGAGNFEVISKENTAWRPSQEITEEQKRKLPVFQEEMRAFTEFLKKKFFEEA